MSRLVTVPELSKSPIEANCVGLSEHRLAYCGDLVLSGLAATESDSQRVLIVQGRLPNAIRDAITSIDSEERQHSAAGGLADRVLGSSVCGTPAQLRGQKPHQAQCSENESRGFGHRRLAK